MNKQFDPAVFAAMQVGKPVALYKKTTLAKVHVQILDPFSGEPVGLLLTGPANSETAQVQVWSVPEDVFFRRMNRRHFESGVVIKVALPEEAPEESHPIEQSSDEEVDEIISRRFAAVQNILQATNSEAFVSRLLDAARKADKSEKFVRAIETRLSELQFVNLKQEE